MRVRPTVALVVLLALSAPLFGPAALAQSAAPPAVAAAAGGGLLLTYEPAREPVPAGRWVALPEGARTLAVTGVRLCRGDDAIEIPEAPAGLVRIGRPMVLRGRAWVAVTLDPSVLDPVARGGPSGFDRLEVRLAPEGSGSKSPVAVLAGLVDETPGRALLAVLDEDAPPGYLIITAPRYESDLAPLAEWKLRKGCAVTVVTTDETGTSLEEIRSYIRNAYETWDPPPLYVLLVGDVEDVPAYFFGGDVTDHPYTLVDGDDYLPDLFIGRFSVEDRLEVQTIVAKTVNYDRHPYTAGGSDWFRRALVVAGDYGSPTPVQTSRYAVEKLQAIGYSRIDSVYYYENGGGYWSGVDSITACVDRGVSIVGYRGWAIGTSGWQPPEFTTPNIGGLSNGWMLPVVFSVVCHTGNFAADSETFGEAWLRVGTPTEPRGAVAFMGNGDPWSHTRWNDRIAAGIYESMADDGLLRLGPILVGSKLRLIDQFPSELWYGETGNQSVEFYFYIYNLQGDPELAIRTQAPGTITVTHPTSVPLGTNFLDVRVTDEGGAPVEGARVGIVQGGVLLGSALTRAGGLASVPASPASGVDSLNITVTGVNLQPYEGVATVSASPSAFLAFGDVTVDDDPGSGFVGNGDGTLNPAENAGLYVTLANTGTAAAVGVTAEIDSLWGAVAEVGTASYGDVAVGGEADPVGAPFVVSVPATAEDGQVVRVELESSFGGSGHSSTLFTLPVSAPDPLYLSSWASADSVLDSGETADLVVRLANAGSAAGTDLSGVLRSRSDLVTVLDSLAVLGDFAPGDTVENAADAFRVAVDPTAPVGYATSFELEVTTAEGAAASVPFTILIGRVDNSAPLGPDAYGYYAYDNSDTDYPEAPLFDWVSCSPAYGGLGQALVLYNEQYVKVALPFEFRFYGVSYDSVLVSDNGWFSFDLGWYRDMFNWHMPNKYGNAAQVAPFWENLNPRRRINGVRVADGVYVWNDTAGHRFVIEWSRVPYSEEAEDDNLQTFEVILYDPDYVVTSKGDGEIVFQYKQIVDVDEIYQRATVGIEDHTETVGLEYAFSGVYPPGAAPLSAGLAVKFTTDAPVREVRKPEVAVLPAGSAGLSCRPNPFNPETMLRFTLPEGGRVTLAVYDVLGREVARLVDGWRDAGSHDLVWDAEGMASGTYFCRIRAGGDTETLKLMLLK